jgi:hypothetical protein
MLLKGAALRHGYDFVRPLGDADVMVRHQDFVRALEVARKLGWAVDSFGKPSPGAHHAVAMLGPSGTYVDLHWTLLFDARWPADEGVWQRSRRVDLGGLTVRVPEASDCLYHICAHGFLVSDPHAWLPDALHLLDFNRIDWELVFQEARRRAVLPAVAECLFFLDRESLAKVPAEVLAEFSKARPALLDRLYFGARRKGFRVSCRVLDFLRHWRECGLMPILPGYLRSLRQRGRARNRMGPQGLQAHSIYAIAGV